MERRKRIAWSVATSSCIKTRQDPVDVYNRLMEEWDEVDEKNPWNFSYESNKT
jgi:hypothetical protein